jgi:hypothetical protein
MYCRSGELLSTSIIFALVADHEHDFPFKYIVAPQPTTYAGKILCLLYFLQLSAQETRGCATHLECMSAVV